ncbi:transposase, partial [Gallicola sp. Sow4_E12]|uniref:transposase n=1 Tax=Gallicola sp. Sow4_E12 TaxID=3438785 RepID=UPI003F93B465
MDKSNPKNKLSKKEENQIFEVLFEERFADKTPHKIVPLLLDQGIYICSPSTMYRRMKEEKLTRKRNTNQKESKPRCKPNVIAYRPNEVAVWDITYLPTLVKGMYFKLLVVMDLYSRKILGTRVFEQDTLEQSKEFLKELVKELDLKRELKVLHGDNGSTLKGKTLSVLLTELGVLESHSRPRVSNDN